MFVGDLELQIISRRRESSLSSVQCRCVLTRVGIKSSLIYQILPVVRMVPITLKHCEYSYTRTVVLEGYTFQTGCIQRRNFHRSSNYFFQCRNNKKDHNNCNHSHQATTTPYRKKDKKTKKQKDKKKKRKEKKKKQKKTLFPWQSSLLFAKTIALKQLFTPRVRIQTILVECFSN